MVTYQEEGEIYLSVSEARKVLGISRQALDGYVKRGELTKYKRTLAHRVFFKQSEINELLEMRPEQHTEKE
jgi:predicted DNA-binding transcriptional regulator AlpA